MTSLLVVAGEASGDRAAASVVSRLRACRPALDVFGMGGAALRREGVELVADLRTTTALGVGEAASRAVAVVRAFRAVTHEAARRAPAAALLVDYTEFNARLARRLRASNVRVLWYGAPQIWAWRPARAATLGRLVDRMAVVLPFEEDLWRRAGVDARYVGHPSCERPAMPRAVARGALGITAASAVAVLPGSRPHEVRRLLPSMLDAIDRARRHLGRIDVRVLVASSLDRRTVAWLRREASSRGVATFDVDPSAGAGPLLTAFDAALCASGTASLEAALAHAPPVVAYRVGLATEIAARWLLRSRHIALPNVLLDRRAFPELLQRGARPAAMAEALVDTLARRDALARDCADVERLLGTGHAPSAEVAAMIAPWLEPSPAIRSAA